MIFHTDAVHHDHPAIITSTTRDAVTLDEERDGATLRVNIRNALPCVGHAYSVCCIFADIYLKSIAVDEVNVTLSGRDGERLTFTAGARQLTPGSNSVTLFCSVSHIFIWVEIDDMFSDDP